MKTARPTLDEFTAAYIECALWSSTDDNGEPIDANYDVDSIDPQALHDVIVDCREFTTAYRELIAGQESQAGHDYWLTRNRHGAGFWDRGDDVYPESVREYLTRISHEAGSVDVYVGDDGQLYFS